MSSPLGASLAQPMVPMVPAGGGFMIPDAVKVPETVPEDIAGERGTTPASQESSRAPTPALQPAPEPEPAAEYEPDPAAEPVPVPEHVPEPVPEPEPVPTMATGTVEDPEGTAFFDRADDEGFGYHAPPSPPAIAAPPTASDDLSASAANVGMSHAVQYGDEPPPSPPLKPPVDVSSLVPPPPAATAASRPDPPHLPPPPTRFGSAGVDDDADEWESVPDGEEEPDPALSDPALSDPALSDPALSDQPPAYPAPGSFFVPSPAGGVQGGAHPGLHDAGFDPLNDPLNDPLKTNNAGAATTAEADAAYDYGDVAASVASQPEPAAPESGGMLFDAVLETNSKKEGYYDERGEWIEGPFPGGFYDASGAWRRGYYDEAGAFHPGYVDSNGEWVAAGEVPAGFYDENGEWTDGPFPGGFVDASGAFRHGYYTERGEFVEGFYDESGGWVSGQPGGTTGGKVGNSEEKWGDVDEGEMTDIAL